MFPIQLHGEIPGTFQILDVRRAAIAIHPIGDVTTDIGVGHEDARLRPQQSFNGDTPSHNGISYRSRTMVRRNGGLRASLNGASGMRNVTKGRNEESPHPPLPIDIPHTRYSDRTA